MTWIIYYHAETPRGVGCETPMWYRLLGHQREDETIYGIIKRKLSILQFFVKILIDIS